MNKSFAMGAALAVLMTAGAANAAIVTVGPGGYNGGYATEITYDNDNAAMQRGTADGRDNGANALGATDGTFFELGNVGSAIFTFGMDFVSPGFTAEITYGDRGGFFEQATVEIGNLVGGVFTAVTSVIVNNTVSGEQQFTFAGGPFNALRFLNSGPILGGTGGFDIDSVRVTPAPVPLPAAGLMLMGALGGMAMLRRKQRAA